METTIQPDHLKPGVLVTRKRNTPGKGGLPYETYRVVLVDTVHKSIGLETLTGRQVGGRWLWDDFCYAGYEPQVDLKTITPNAFVRAVNREDQPLSGDAIPGVIYQVVAVDRRSGQLGLVRLGEKLPPKLWGYYKCFAVVAGARVHVEAPAPESPVTVETVPERITRVTLAGTLIPSKFYVEVTPRPVVDDPVRVTMVPGGTTFNASAESLERFATALLALSRQLQQPPVQGDPWVLAGPPVRE